MEDIILVEGGEHNPGVHYRRGSAGPILWSSESTKVMLHVPLVLFAS